MTSNYYNELKSARSMLYDLVTNSVKSKKDCQLNLALLLDVQDELTATEQDILFCTNDEEMSMTGRDFQGCELTGRAIITYKILN